jgi:MFS superfamily sulfate permease-like transporter
MKVEIAIAIAIGWFVLRAIVRAMKKNKEKLQRGGQNSNNSTNTAQNFIDNASAEARQVAAAEERETHYLDRPVEEIVTASITDSFYEPKNLEDNRSGHYNEDNLVEEYEQTHAEGRTVSHHKHKLFNELKDRQKASRHTSYAGKPLSARQHSQPSTIKRAERRGKTVNPIAAALKGKDGLKQAFIMAEVLKRPEF